MLTGHDRGRAAKDPLSLALRSLRGAFLAVGAFSLFANLAMLISPIYMLQVYDRVLTSHSKETLVLLTAVAVGLLIVNALVVVARSRVLVRICARLDEHLSTKVFASAFMGRLSGSEQSPSQALHDLETLRSALTGAGVIAIFDAPWTPIYLAFVFALHPLLGAIAAFGALVIVALALLSEAATRSALSEAGNGSRKAADFTDQLARTAEVVHAMGFLDGLTTRWQRFHHYGFAWQAIASDRIAILQATAKCFRMCQQVAILGAGAWLALDGSTSPGAMVAASIIMGRALAPVEALIGHWRSLVQARHARQRLASAFAFIENEKEERTKLPAPDGRLVVHSVGIRLPGGDAPAVSGIAFELEPGEALGIIGPSGAGKSTLARLLVGLWEPSVGCVRLDGVEVASWPRSEFGPYVGYLPQDVELLAGTIAANISRFGKHDSDRIVTAGKIAGVHDLIVNLPDGYETLVGEGGRVLSGGQRQRIGLARAVYGDARFIVLDEPNANLDIEGEVALRRTLAHLKAAGCTVAMITHKPLLLGSVDKILVIRDGRQEMFGTRDHVLGEINRLVKSTQRPGDGRQSLAAAAS